MFGLKRSKKRLVLRAHMSNYSQTIRSSNSVKQSIGTTYKHITEKRNNNLQNYFFLLNTTIAEEQPSFTIIKSSFSPVISEEIFA